MDNEKSILLLSHLYVQNANAVSGPLTWGFPAPSAFLGFMHALGLQIPSEFSRMSFGGVGIICHRFFPQVTGDKYSKTFNLARHPVDKNGDTAAFLEEGKVHLEISLVIEVAGYLFEDQTDVFAQDLLEKVQTMRMAGGSVLWDHRSNKSKIKYFRNPEDFKKIRRRLLPGFALVSRHDLLASHYYALNKITPEATTLDALLDLARLNIDQTIDLNNTEKATWEPRAKQGWLVPIPIGYGAISTLNPAGTVANCRDETTPVQFVESWYSLGEWVSPHRISDYDALFWRYKTQVEAGQYLCVNEYEKFKT